VPIFLFGLRREIVDKVGVLVGVVPRLVNHTYRPRRGGFVSQVIRKPGRVVVFEVYVRGPPLPWGHLSEEAFNGRLCVVLLDSEAPGENVVDHPHLVALPAKRVAVEGQHEVLVDGYLILSLPADRRARAVQYEAVGIFPVPTCAPGLLVKGLDGLGHVDVNRKADVGLVDAHSEGLCRDQKGQVIPFKCILGLFEPLLVGGVHVLGRPVIKSGLPIQILSLLPEKPLNVFRPEEPRPMRGEDDPSVCVFPRGIEAFWILLSKQRGKVVERLQKCLSLCLANLLAKLVGAAPWGHVLIGFGAGLDCPDAEV